MSRTFRVYAAGDYRDSLASNYTESCRADHHSNFRARVRETRAMLARAYRDLPADDLESMAIDMVRGA